MMLCNRFRVLVLGLLGGATAVTMAAGPAYGQRRCVVAEITIAPVEASVAVGGTQPYLATAYNRVGDICENVTFTWLSSNRAVATIGSDGVATGVAVGTTTITARVGSGASARTSNQVTLTVGAGAPAGRAVVAAGTAMEFQPQGTGRPTSLVVEPLRRTLAIGEAWRPGFRAVKADGSNAERVPLSFTIEQGEGVVALDSTGLIRALEEGTASVRIVATRPAGLPARLVAVEVRADSLAFRQRTLSIAPGQTDSVPLWLTGENREFSNLGGTFQFTSSDPNRARVNPDRPVIEAIAPGLVRIIAQSAQYPDVELLVSVHQPVSRLTLDAPDTLLLPIGVSRTLRARALNADSQEVAEAPVRWENSDQAVASFDPGNGRLEARRVGVTTVSVRAPHGRDSSITRSVLVRVIAGGLRASAPRLGLPVGGRQALDVVMLDDRGQDVGSAMAMVTWTSSADSIVAFDSGHAVARRPGRARLTARAPWDSTVSVDVAVAGDLLVSALREGRWDLFVLWSNNTIAIPLTADSAIEGQPAWSPDLRRIAYMVLPHGRAAGSALWVANVDGSGKVRLTDDSSLVQWPRWVSPTRLVFEWGRGGRSQIWAWDFETDSTGSARQLTNMPMPSTAPSVSPDGRRIIYLGQRETSPGRLAQGIFTMNADGSDERQVFTGQRLDQPSFTPDGQSIYFLRDDGSNRQPSKRLYRLRIGLPPDSAQALTPGSLFVQSYSFSPDGSRIALGVSERSPQNQEVRRAYVLDVATQQATSLSPVPDERMAAPVYRPDRPAAPAAPARP
jgi:uncharacterized protein YjdB